MNELLEALSASHSAEQLAAAFGAAIEAAYSNNPRAGYAAALGVLAIRPAIFAVTEEILAAPVAAEPEPVAVPVAEVPGVVA